MAHSFALLAPAQRQAFLPIDALDPFVIHIQTIPPQHSIQSWTAPPPALFGQCAQPLTKLCVPVGRGRATKTAPRYLDQPARATLRQTVVGHYIRHHLSLYRGP